jgi:taurine dioxygenase
MEFLNYKHIETTRLCGTFGAEVAGVDLTSPLPDEVLVEVKQAFLEHSLLIFRNQHLEPKDQINFASQFGTLDRHPIVRGIDDAPEVTRIEKEANCPTTFGEVWHSDNSFTAEPSMGSVLTGIVVPPYGNDTVFANMNAVYNSLSSGMKEMLLDLKAIHTASRAFSYSPSREAKYKGDASMKYEESDILNQEFHHPVVRTHPETGKKAIYVNEMFTIRFQDMTEEESLPLLEYLFSLPSKPEFQCRIKWESDMVAMWDNRILQHVAVNDCNKFRRVMHRVTLKGDCPF